MKEGGQKYRDTHRGGGGGGGRRGGGGAVFRQRIIHREVLQKKPEEKVFYTGLADRVKSSTQDWLTESKVLHRTD